MRLAACEKKTLLEDATLILWDESSFSLSPHRRATWAPVGRTPTLIEAPRESPFTGLGFLTVTPRRLDLDVRLTLLPEGINTSECLYWLNEIHRYYRRKVMIVGDGLPAHQAGAVCNPGFYGVWTVFPL